MWLLSSDGDALGGKRRWLRPGTSHLLGRTSNKVPGGEQTYVAHESISRKHITLHIANVKPGDSGRVHCRSLITATESSKKGTVINGQHYKSQLITFDASKTEYIIELAHSPEKLKIEWRPVVITVTGITKAQRKEGKALSKEIEKLGHTDIKLVTSYLVNETTHVIGKSRNTPTVLQALVQARWVVTDRFLDALAKVCRAHSVENEASALEDDFDLSWPKETAYILPSGTEPVKRENRFLQPREGRAQLFKDYTFIFLLRDQYEKLLPVIAGGGGKGVLCESQNGLPSAIETVTFTHEVAGKKGARYLLLSEESGPGVVLVRPEVKDDGRTDEVVNEIEQALNQYMIDQKAFLEMILSEDVSPLRRPLRGITQISGDEEMQDDLPASSSIPEPPTDSNGQSQARTTLYGADLEKSFRFTSRDPDPSTPFSREPQITQEQPEIVKTEHPNALRRRRIVTTQPRAKFGEDYDPSSVIRATSDSPEPAQGPGEGASIEHRTDFDKSAIQNTDVTRGSRKRPAVIESEDEPEETEEQKNDRMYPHQAALKRRKLEEQKSGLKPPSRSTPAPGHSPVRPEDEIQKRKGKRKALEPEPEIKEKLRARVMFDEEQRLDEEAKADMSTMTAEELKQIAEEHKDDMIVTFEVLDLGHTRQDPAETNTDHPQWEGRTNFKRFRSNKVQRQGQRHSGAREKPDQYRDQRSLVTLVPVPGKGRGIGDEYWLGINRDRNNGQPVQTQALSLQSHEPTSRSPSRTSSFAARRQAAAAVGEANVYGEEDDADAFRRRLQRSREEDRDDEDAHNAIDEPVRGAAVQGPSRSTAGSSQTLGGGDTQSHVRNANGKRPARELGAGEIRAPSTKKTRQVISTRTPGNSFAASSRSARSRQDDDVDDDPTAFRRTRR